MTKSSRYDFIVVGAGSAGCVVAARLAEMQAGSILLIEAGPSDNSPLVRMPFGLVWNMGSKRRDWRYHSTPQAGLNGRTLRIPRGRVLGGSGSINSMVWFRGTRGDFDGWGSSGWCWHNVEPDFEAVEARLMPVRLVAPHPVTEKLNGLFSANDPAASPSPDRESAGVFTYNMRAGQRWSAADVYLRPALSCGLQVITGNPVKRIGFKDDRAHAVHLADGTLITAGKGIVLSAGSIGSAEILLKSGVGPAEDLRKAGIDPVLNLAGVGENLHDHPGVGIHYAGANSGYGFAPSLALHWMAAPFAWAFASKGIFASPTVEGGAFFNAANDGGEPDIQSHFIPFKVGWTGSRYTLGRGYFADAVVCRPKSRGRLSITRDGLNIDLGIFNDERDLDLLVKGWLRLRALMAAADFGVMKAVEVFPANDVVSEEQVRDFARAHAATAYHPVGTLRMGDDAQTPVDERLRLRGLGNLWVADASIMPKVTSANTNAPSMMIGHRAARLITEEAA